MADKGFGGRVFQARHELAVRRGRAVTQVEIGKALGVTGVTVGRWEAGEKEPDLETITRLAAFFGVHPGWLAFGDATHLPGPVDSVEPVGPDDNGGGVGHIQHPSKNPRGLGGGSRRPKHHRSVE
jgi:DNA-binding XRE family transcriptional regulator